MYRNRLVIQLAGIFLLTSALLAQGGNLSLKEALTISGFADHTELALKLGDLRSHAHITVTIHNLHSNADEAYSGVRL